MKTNIYTPFWMRLLTHLDKGEDYPSSISKKLDTTYAHVVEVGNEFKRRRLLTVTRVGRRTMWELTERGRDYAIAASTLVELAKKVRR